MQFLITITGNEGFEIEPQNFLYREMLVYYSGYIRPNKSPLSDQGRRAAQKHCFLLMMAIAQICDQPTRVRGCVAFCHPIPPAMLPAL